jgi:hydrogenase expression/formation protein HypD
VPGSSGILIGEKARGADVRVVTSPLDALGLARDRAEQVVFLAVGFETTVPGVAATVQAAAAEGISNFSILCAHKTIPAALEALAGRPGSASLDGLLCPGHVSVIIGTRPYEGVARRGIPCVVGGFEPVEILSALALLLEQRRRGEARVENAYGWVVRPEGNARAVAIVERTFAACDAVWRGLGRIPGSGLELRPGLERFDAALRFPVELEPPREPAGCICGEILRGAAEPGQCPLFGTACTPEDPAGACMVSSEGTCAAHFRYLTRSAG